MKKLVLRAAVAAALVIGSGSGSAFAGMSSGHWAWKPAPQFGPRGAFQAPKRVWVADRPKEAECACAMMKAHAQDCMKMHGQAA